MLRCRGWPLLVRTADQGHTYSCSGLRLGAEKPCNFSSGWRKPQIQNQRPRFIFANYTCLGSCPSRNPAGRDRPSSTLLNCLPLQSGHIQMVCHEYSLACANAILRNRFGELVWTSAPAETLGITLQHRWSSPSAGGCSPTWFNLSM